MLVRRDELQRQDRVLEKSFIAQLELVSSTSETNSTATETLPPLTAEPPMDLLAATERSAVPVWLQAGRLEAK